MAGSVEHQRGGILSLCRLIERYGEAIEFDLLNSGWTLDELGERLSWRDLLVLIQRWQQVADTALAEAIHGKVWKVTDQLLAEVIDVLNVANWQRAGKKSAPRPKRFPRPWEKPRGRKLGADPVPISKFNDWWEARSKHGRKRRGARNSVGAADL